MNPEPTAAPADQAGAAAEIDEAEIRDLDRAMAEVEPATARRVLAAAVVAFAARGYHATSTRDIAAQAGLSPAGVYVHFRSKEDLLHRISLIGTRHTHEAVRAADEAAGDPTARLRAVISVLATRAARYHTTGRVIEYELGSLDKEHYAQIAALRREIEACVRRILDDGVRAGGFDVPDVPATVIALLSLTMDISRWYHTGGRRSPAEIGALYADLAVRMVRAVPSA
jgi:AcrR family transcriptional regulator